LVIEYGTYQLVEDVIKKYDKEDVVPYLKTALKSENIYVQYRCCQIAEFFLDERLIPELKYLTLSSIDDVRKVAELTLEAVMIKATKGGKIKK
jgi:hypothetical protein